MSSIDGHREKGRPETDERGTGDGRMLPSDPCDESLDPDQEAAQVEAEREEDERELEDEVRKNPLYQT